MKQGIHPDWHPQATVTCSCGHSFTVGSTLPSIQVDICSNCHPFFTGEMKFVDRQGRVDKFMARQKAAEAAKKQLGGKKTKKSKKSQQSPAQSYQEILRSQQGKNKKSAPAQ